ncbi:uncharacterized protein LOC118757280 [Rhagoletis pomonella]|uniref:uncharacterized protein LOC118757280 n=1 Tax=Rhagoletis pomonella TaxID=28610 RepID=UPI00177D9484|nr:uncharacterized protein LOC118757280 [Rhagoletis pomonella]
MGKHKSSLQDSIMVRFMESNPDMAKGFIKGDKAKSDMQWRELVNELNSNGPPTKDVMGWKKVWIDWKTTVRKKKSHTTTLKPELRVVDPTISMCLPLLKRKLAKFAESLKLSKV